jgi:hypothetical protein
MRRDDNKDWGGGGGGASIHASDDVSDNASNDASGDPALLIMREEADAMATAVEDHITRGAAMSASIVG